MLSYFAGIVDVQIYLWTNKKLKFVCRVLNIYYLEMILSNFYSSWKLIEQVALMDAKEPIWTDSILLFFENAGLKKLKHSVLCWTLNHYA